MAQALAAGDSVVYSQTFLDNVARPCGARVADLRGRLDRVEYGWLGTVDWSDGKRTTVNLSNLERHTPAPQPGTIVWVPEGYDARPDGSLIRFIPAARRGSPVLGVLTGLLVTAAAGALGWAIFG
ncbi:hypothetical protein [Roseomonas sp. USHLN139]|uniref:hypothetical protein n=1 Tax=Roseomonas sp. USHLN139 TaxID=3081298 RepID=UPI003B02D52D